jgi:hypothetical protein
MNNEVAALLKTLQEQLVTLHRLLNIIQARQLQVDREIEELRSRIQQLPKG